MSVERELLWRIQQVLQCERDDYGFVGEIENLLTQPKQEPEPYLTELDRKSLKEATTTLSKVEKRLKSKDTWDEYLHIMVGDAMGNIFDMMSDKESPPKREPLSEDEIDLSTTGMSEFGSDMFKAGIRAAERAHGIGVDDE
jgi:hypothetical protein